MRSKPPAGIIHYPNLKTVLMVEEVLQNAEKPLTRTEIKKRLKTKVMHQTLNVILKYLDESCKIIDWKGKIVWAHNNSPKVKRLLKRSQPADEIFRELHAKYDKKMRSSQ
jgi:hypothetical protein